MLIKRLMMENFRQFYGENEIFFSTQKKKNITLIHGENGVGKTTILNAILWCMFEKLTPDFEQPEKLLCSAAIAEKKYTCRVEVEFVHESDQYVAHRTVDTKADKKTFRIHRVEPDGNFETIPNAWAFMNSVLPEAMAEYFFFHGEGISNINTKSSGAKFRRAIRDILGFTFAEAAVDDLKAVKAKWSTTVKELSLGQENLNKSLTERSRLEEQLQRLEKEANEVNEEISEYGIAYEDVSSQILRYGNQDATSLQRSIRSGQKDSEQIHVRITSLAADRQSLIQKYGWSIFGAGLANKGLEFIDESTLKGRIPAPYDETLVKDLIEAKRCICGRDLIEGTPEHKCVLSLIETANTALIQQRLQKARSVADKIRGMAREFLVESQKLEKELEIAHKRLREVERNIEQYQSDLAAIDVQAINDLQARALLLQRQRDAAVTKKGRLGGDLSRVKDAQKAANREITRLSTTDTRLARLQACEQVINGMIERCGTRLEEYERASHNSIEGSVNEILERFSRKDYVVKLTENFDFHLVKRTGEVVAKSKGENLLLNLSFVSALIRLAQVRQDSTDDFLVAGTVAPFVIDAPFGELDETYKAATAEFLPKNCEQLVLLLSSSHWKGTVDEAIRARVGSEYVLVSHKTSKRGSKPTDEIRIGNKQFTQSLYEQKRERTEIEGV